MRQATGNSGIEMSPWRAFDFGKERRALIHLPSSTVLEVSERIFKAATRQFQSRRVIIDKPIATIQGALQSAELEQLGTSKKDTPRALLEVIHRSNTDKRTNCNLEQVNSENLPSEHFNAADVNSESSSSTMNYNLQLESKISRKEKKVEDENFTGLNEDNFYTSFEMEAIKKSHFLTKNEFDEEPTHDEEALKFLEATHLALGGGKFFQTEPIDIRSIALNVEESCNLRCTYCYAGDGNYGHDSRMHHEIAIQSIAQLSKGKPKFHIAFFGGEPLLNFPLIKSVVLWCESQRETNFSFGITTNATLLNSTHLSFFKEHKVSLKISYDGDKAQSIQRLTVDRKQNVAAQVKRKISKYYTELDSLGMSIRATFGKDGSVYFKESIEGLLDDFQSHVSYSKVASFDSNHSITLKEVEAVGEDLTTIIRKLLSQKNYEKIMRITNIAASMKILHKGYVNRMTCGAGIGYISVSTKGEYFLCHRFTESREEKVGDLKSGLNYEKLAEIQKYRAGEHAPCNTCWMQRYCRGGCFQENKVEHGELFKPSEIFCRMQEIELSLALEVYLEMKLNSPDLVEKFL